MNSEDFLNKILIQKKVFQNKYPQTNKSKSPFQKEKSPKANYRLPGFVSSSSMK